MSKTIPIALATHYARKSQTTAILVTITRRDGEVFGCTSHDADLLYLGLNYVSGLPSIETNQVVHSSSFASDNTEMSGLLSTEGLSQEDIEAGDWDGAAVEILRVNWQSLADGHETIGVGELGQFSHDGVKYKVEYKGMTDRLHKTIVRSYLPLCDAIFGDARCGLDAASFTFPGVVTAVVDRANFTDSALAQAAQYFTQGKVTWLTGNNALRAMEVKNHEAGGVIELELPMAREIQVGDTFDILVGDDHHLETCRDKFSNIVNYRGFNYLPGNDQLVRAGGQ